MTGMTVNDLRRCVDMGWSLDPAIRCYDSILCETGTGAQIEVGIGMGADECTIYLQGNRMPLAWHRPNVDAVIEAMGGIVGIVGLE